MSFWRELGIIAYPLAIVGIFLVVQIARGTRDVASPTRTVESTLRIHSILLWGTLGAAVGVFGTLGGLMQMAGVMAELGDASPALVRDYTWNGVRLALSSSVVGLTMLGLAAVAWLALQTVKGRREAEV